MRQFTQVDKRKFMTDMRKIFNAGIWIPTDTKSPFGRLMPNAMVAVMDILGFKEIINRNASPGAMQSLCLKLERALGNARSYGMYKRYFPRTKKLPIQRIKEAQDRIEVFLFSDTLILICPDVQKGDAYALFGFIEAACGAVNALFESGFPVRAFIDYGDCLRSDKANFIIGKPFLDAFQEAEKMSFSGLCISDKAKKIACSDSAMAHRWGVDVLAVPIKGCVADVERNCIDWLRTASDKNFALSGVHQFVVECLTQNGKTIDTDRSKELLNNTVRVIMMMAKTQKRMKM